MLTKRSWRLEKNCVASKKRTRTRLAGRFWRLCVNQHRYIAIYWHQNHFTCVFMQARHLLSIHVGSLKPDHVTGGHCLDCLMTISFGISRDYAYVSENLCGSWWSCWLPIGSFRSWESCKKKGSNGSTRGWSFWRLKGDHGTRVERIYFYGFYGQDYGSTKCIEIWWNILLVGTITSDCKLWSILYSASQHVVIA